MMKTKILIVEDQADTRLIEDAMLKKHRYETVFAMDAQQVVALARQAQPDAIILDLGLPGGHGFVVLDRLKSNTQLKGIPVIVMTSDHSPESELRGLEAGAVAFLHKPVQEESLIAAVECAVGRVDELQKIDTGPAR